MQWYVCMHEPEGKRRMSLLDGPFASQDEAQGRVRIAQRFASKVDPWTDFNVFGVHAIDSHRAPVAIMRRPGAEQVLAEIGG